MTTVSDGDDELRTHLARRALAVLHREHAYEVQFYFVYGFVLGAAVATFAAVLCGVLFGEGTPR